MCSEWRGFFHSCGLLERWVPTVHCIQFGEATKQGEGRGSFPPNTHSHTQSKTMSPTDADWVDKHWNQHTFHHLPPKISNIVTTKHSHSSHPCSLQSQSSSNGRGILQLPSPSHPQTAIEVMTRTVTNAYLFISWVHHLAHLWLSD